MSGRINKRRIKKGRKEASDQSKGAARPRAAKKDPYTDEGILFGPKSPLIEMDLHKYFVNPKAWNILDEEEKTKIRGLLPAHLAWNDDGSIPQDFLKYDNDWRNAVRQFQDDIAAGRYEKEWLHQAAEAMEEREAGVFDNWKEEQFEEFWGQKQKLSSDVVAGAMSKLKLEEMIKNGVFKVGDAFSFGRVFGKGPGRVLVEKEVIITAIEGSKLVVEIPPGHRKYLATNRVSSSDIDASDNAKPETSHQEASVENDMIVEGATTNNRTDMMDKDSHDNSVITEAIELDGKASNDEQITLLTARSSPLSEPHSVSSQSSSPPDDPISFTLTSLRSLETKILEIDGRVTRPPNGNAWKVIRAKRNNQDMGSLWEMREEYYVRNYS